MEPSVFKDRLLLAEKYHDLLATDSSTAGLSARARFHVMGTHLINCAVIGDVMDEGATVVDVGSGAGLRYSFSTPVLICGSR